MYKFKFRIDWIRQFGRLSTEKKKEKQAKIKGFSGKWGTKKSTPVLLERSESAKRKGERRGKRKEDYGSPKRIISGDWKLEYGFFSKIRKYYDFSELPDLITEFSSGQPSRYPLISQVRQRETARTIKIRQNLSENFRTGQNFLKIELAMLVAHHFATSRMLPLVPVIQLLFVAIVVAVQCGVKK